MEEDVDIVDELEMGTQARRTAFLSVLCILTWTWSGAVLLFFTWVFLLGGKSWDTSGTARWMTNFWWFAYSVGPSVICTFGAVMMWRLNRWGFLVYLAGQLIPVIFSFYLAMSVNNVRGASLIFTILANVIPIGFIVLYAIHLPGMKPWRPVAAVRLE